MSSRGGIALEERTTPAEPVSPPRPGVQRPRWPRRLVISLIVLGVAGWIGFCALSLFQAAHHVKRGVDTIDQVKGHLSSAQLIKEEAVPPLLTAQAQFQEAHRLMHQPALAPLRWLPFIGRQLRSVDALSAAAGQVSKVGAEAVHQAHGVLEDKGQRTAEDRLALMRNLSAMATRTNAELQRVHLGPSSGLVGPLAKRRNQFAADLSKAITGLSQGQAANDALIDVLGNSRTYLVLAANNDEMRAGSGMFLQAGVLTTNGQGKFALGDLTTTESLLLPAPGPAMPPDLAARWGFLQPNQEWRNLGLTPRFDVNAELAAQMWTARTGQPIDGVLAFDIAAFKEVLGVNGPVQFGPETLDADHIEQYLMHDQYLSVPSTATAQTQRREGLGVLAGVVFNVVNNTEISYTRLAPAVARAAAGRHIMAWAARPSIERDWVAAGVAGQLGPDDLLVSIINRGGNKLDYYLGASGSVAIKPGSTGTDVDVQVTLSNPTPAGQPPYIAGQGRSDGVEPGDYAGFVSFTFPGRAGNAQVTGNPPIVTAGTDGPDSRVLASSVVVKRGQTVQVSFHFRLAGQHGQLRLDPSARLPQPMTWQLNGHQVVDDSAHIVRW